MRIFLISNLYPSKLYASHAPFVRNFKKQFKQENFSFPHPALIYGKSKNIFEKFFKYILFFKDIISGTRCNDYDLIYIHFAAHPLLPLIFFKKNIKKPLVINTHGSDILPIRLSGKIILFFVTPIIKKADLIVVPSKYFSEIVQTKFDIHASKIFISPSAGVNLQIFQPKHKVNKSNLFTIGYVSRIEDNKGWDILIDSINQLVKNELQQHIKVVIIGDGKDRQRMLKKIDLLNLKNYIEYLHAIPQQDLSEAYNSMDIFVFPTLRQESLGLVGLEAMACGVPVIGSAVGGLKEYVLNEYNGFQFQPGNSKQLSQCILKFLVMNQEELNHYRSNAIKTAMRYDANIVNNSLKQKMIFLVKNYGNKIT